MVDSVEAAEILTNEVTRVLIKRKPMRLEIDASSFGRLSFLLAPEESRISKGGLGITATVLHRARWLAATVESLRRKGLREVGVDGNSRAALGEVASYPGCNALGELVTIPAEVVPHARALTAMLNESRNFAEHP